MMTLSTYLQRYSVTPLVKQAPLTVLVALAAVLSLTVPQLVVSSEPGLYLAVGLTVAATVCAWVMTAKGLALSPWVNIVPALDFLALGILRWSTGSAASIFTALVVLPVVWLAAQEGRRFVAFAALGTALVILTPFIVGIGDGDRVIELLRLVIVVLVYTSLAAVVNELSRQFGIQLRLTQAREKVIQMELNRAAEVQRSLLPQALSSVSGYSFAGTCLPAATVGGDFFDWYRTDDGVAITLGDVMGKGVGAGLIAAAVRAVLRSSRIDPDPSAALVRASEGLSTDFSDGSAGTGTAFTTLFHARLSGNVLRWADAGHGLTVVLRDNGSVERLSTTNLPVGIGIEDTWLTKETHLEPGDLIVVFSDGVLDLFGGGLDTFDHIVQLAQKDLRPSVIVTALSELARSTEHEDDVTVVAIRRSPVWATQETRADVTPVAFGGESFSTPQ
jgi:sigma-B regulation protein RsbU (phosphoserine phosphatase)